MSQLLNGDVNDDEIKPLLDQIKALKEDKE
jgi:hypothetical protein